MKKKIIVFINLIVILMAVASCADEKKKVNEPTEVKKEDPHFSLKMTVVVRNDDLFELFYIEDENEKYSGNGYLTSKVIGSDLKQEINYKLESNTYPYNLKIDFGTNKNQKEVEVLECIFKYSNDEYKVKGKDLYKYFNFHMMTQSSEDSTKYIISSDYKVYDPYMTGNNRFKEVLNIKI